MHRAQRVLSAPHVLEVTPQPRQSESSSRSTVQQQQSQQSQRSSSSAHRASRWERRRVCVPSVVCTLPWLFPFQLVMCCPWTPQYYIFMGQ